MDEKPVTNFAELCGTLAAAPKYSHSARGVSFLTFPLEVERLSGTTDTLNIIVRRDMLDSLDITEAGKIHLAGEVRSFNNKSGEGAKLVISVFAKDMELCDCEDMNRVSLIGTVCKPPNRRTTPMGRDICDLMLAVNRRYGRSDYLPCITWGLNARAAALWEVGTTVRLNGRLQSRGYIKLIDNMPVEKTAYEVSVIDITESV